jgi:(p)ppGpp synthase/HD superfamily hydrolase
MKELGLAILIATKAHYKQKQRNGSPYILHPLHVMSKIEPYGNYTMMTVAILHDVVEDTEYTYQMLSEEGISELVITSLKLLDFSNCNTDEEYFNQIKLLKQDVYAKAVKKEDLLHNLDVSRLPKVSEKDILRMQKYKKAFIYLNT